MSAQQINVFGPGSVGPGSKFNGWNDCLWLLVNYGFGGAGHGERRWGRTPVTS